MVAPGFTLSAGQVSGGLAGVTLYLCRALVESGLVDLQVVRPEADPGLPEIMTIDGITVHPLVPPAGESHSYHIMCGIRRQVTAKVNELRPDVVHEQGMAHVAGCRALVVVTLHGIVEVDALFRGSRWTRWLRYAFLKIREGRSRKSWPNVISISPYARRFLSDHGRQRVWDIPNPVADSFFDVVRAPVPGRVFSASHIQPLKNTAGLLRAFAGVAQRQPGARLRLAGSGADSPYGQECRRLAAALGIGDQVDFLGLLSIEQVKAELAAAAVFALCSLQENAPLSIAEAMAAGVPVLASDVGGVPSMVDDGLTGRLARPADPAAVARQLARMLEADDLAAMGAAGRAKAGRSYRASEVARQTIEVYRTLARASDLAPSPLAGARQS